MGLVKPRRESPPPVKLVMPTGGGRKAVWPGVLERVAGAAGEWMVVGEYATRVSATHTAYHVRKSHDPAGRFEFVSRTVDGKGVLYARLKTAGAK